MTTVSTLSEMMLLETVVAFQLLLLETVSKHFVLQSKNRT